ARPNPFIPIALQKKAGIPQASAEGSLALDRRITEKWAGSAKEVVFSWPEKEQDRDLAPSALILSYEKSSALVADLPRYRDVLFASKRLESFEDSKAPPVATKQVRGGTRVLADQAACPFRAFARWRLAAEALEEPAPGLDARKRGSLLHHLMKHLWSKLKTSRHLRHDLQPALAEAAAAAATQLGLEGRFAELERERLPDPQLPLYAVSAPENIAAVAFARLNPGEMAFRGFSKERNLLPKVEVYRDWRGLLDQWRKQARDLGAAFAAGDARIDPKYA